GQRETHHPRHRVAPALAAHRQALCIDGHGASTGTAHRGDPRLRPAAVLLGDRRAGPRRRQTKPGAAPARRMASNVGMRTLVVIVAMALGLAGCANAEVPQAGSTTPTTPPAGTTTGRTSATSTSTTEPTAPSTPGTTVSRTLVPSS